MVQFSKSSEENCFVSINYAQNLDMTDDSWNVIDERAALQTRQ